MPLELRVLRWILGAASALAGLLLVAAGALWLWSGSEGSADWVLQQVARRQPLVAEGVRGSLRGGLQAQRLAWSQDGLTVEAREVQLAWQPLALLQRLLQVDRLQAASLRVEDRRPETGERPQPPASLALPVRVAVEQLVLGQVEWAGPPAVTVDGLAASYGYDGQAHQLDLQELRVFDGRYSGQVRIGAREPFTLESRLQGRLAAPVPGAPAPLALELQASANGPLAGFEARLQLRALGAGATAAPSADASATVTPWRPVPVQRAQAEVRALDLGALWPQAPHTLLSGQIALQPQDPATVTVSADLRNAASGPWDQQRVPVEALRLEGDWRLPGAALVRELDAQVGGGRVRARGEWQDEGAWSLEGTLSGINPAAVHSAMAPLPLGGRAKLRAQGPAIAFETELRASAPPAATRGNAVAAAVGALELRSLRARGRWAGGELSLPVLEARTSDARLDAALELHPARRSGRGRADLEAPGLRVRAVGSLAAAQGGGTVRLSATDAGQAQRWLQKLPGAPQALGARTVAGRAELQLEWQGGWVDPTVQSTLDVPQLQAAAAGEAAAWSVRDATVRVDGRLADARIELRGKGAAGTREANLELAGRGGRRSDAAWQGQLATLDLGVRDAGLGPRPWRALLRRPVDLRWSAGQLDVGAGEATLAAPVAGTMPSQAQLAWEPARWRGGELRTVGRLTGLPLAWGELLGGAQAAGAAVAGDLVFDGQWDAQLGEALRLRASLARSRGDVSVLAETGAGTSARVQAGVREARIDLQGDGEALTLSLRWDSERAGSAEGRLATRLARDGGGWSWPAAAPLSGRLQAQLPRLGVWSLLAPPGWRLRGSVAADVAVAGTRVDPRFTGSVRADHLALRSVVDGVALQDGRLRARLEGRRVLLDEFVLHGAGTGGGTLRASGEGAWQDGGVQVRATAQLDRLRASIRDDRELTVSGQAVARMDAAGGDVRGELRVDRARIRLPDQAAPRLGDDVVVRNLPPGAALGREQPAGDATRAAGRSVTLALQVDLGGDFRVQGRGIDTRLAGSLQVTGTSLAEPRLLGQIRTTGGEYQAYGQQLEIERGELRFTGPIDNPALDVLAIRPRLTQRVGVQITGTAQAPFVRLYAEPDLPEAEKLAWLVLGRAAAAGGAETALLQQAALALVQSRRGGGTGNGPAALLGLDELGFSRSGAEGPAVTLGKRLGRNLYASYERSLSGTLGTLYVFYDLSRRVTVRAQAGERAALDLIFTFAYD